MYNLGYINTERSAALFSIVCWVAIIDVSYLYNIKNKIKKIIIFRAKSKNLLKSYSDSLL